MTPPTAPDAGAEPTRPDLLEWGLFVFSLALIAVCELRYFSPFRFLDPWDEGYELAMGLRLLETHGLPYVDAVSQRGPLMYGSYALGLKLGGPFNLLVPRVGGLVLTLAATGLLFTWLVRERMPAAASMAALGLAFSLTGLWAPGDALIWGGEIMGMITLLASRIAAREGAGPGAAALSGFFAAVTFFIKQTLGIFLPVTFLWLLARSPDRASRVRAGLAFAGACGAVTLLVLAPYALGGHLSDFIYYFFVYGRSVHMAPVTWRCVWEALQFGVVDRGLFSAAGVLGAAWAIRRLLLCWRSRDAHQALWPGLLLTDLLAAIVSASFAGRTYGYHFLPVDLAAVTLIAMALQATLAPWVRRSRWGRPTRLAGALLAEVVMLAACQVQGRREAALAQSTEMFRPEDDPLSRWIREHSAPTDPLFVWGFRGDLYMTSQRWPASRFVYAIYPAGIIPYFWATWPEIQRRIVPGSHEQLIDDLEKSRPKLIVDNGVSLDNCYMVDYPDLDAYLSHQYCQAAVVAGTPIYERRGSGECAPIAPRPRACGAPEG